MTILRGRALWLLGALVLLAGLPPAISRAEGNPEPVLLLVDTVDARGNHVPGVACVEDVVEHATTPLLVSVREGVPLKVLAASGGHEMTGSFEGAEPNVAYWVDPIGGDRRATCDEPSRITFVFRPVLIEALDGDSKEVPADIWTPFSGWLSGPRLWSTGVEKAGVGSRHAGRSLWVPARDIRADTTLYVDELNRQWRDATPGITAVRFLFGTIPWESLQPEEPEAVEEHYDDVEVSPDAIEAGRRALATARPRALESGPPAAAPSPARRPAAATTTADVQGPAIPITANTTSPLHIAKLPVADCRAVRGFIGAPVDGRTDTPGYRGTPWEYGSGGSGAGVAYVYRRTDGLHITLADRGAVNAVLIRGGAQAKLYGPGANYEGPRNAPLVWTFPTNARRSRALFEVARTGGRFSFFDVVGTIADVSFLRVKQGRGDLPLPGPPTTWTGPFGLAPNQPLQLDMPACTADTPVAAIWVDLSTPDAVAGTVLTLAVPDPLDPKVELMAADLALPGPGRFRVILNFPDQIVPIGTTFSLSATADRQMTIDTVEARLHVVTEERALPQALEYRKLMLKSRFAVLSEPRPWTTWEPGVELEAWLMDQPLVEPLRDLFASLDQCRYLGPDDDIVRQYYEWIRRRHDGLSPYAPAIPCESGVPEWATVLHQAWLEAREVPVWWVKNRMTPTGEFGGWLEDDTDMYQNYACFPMLEDTDLATRLRRGAAALAALIEERLLRNGLNVRTDDPLHAYESGLNHEALLAWWNYGDPVYLERCMATARATEALMTTSPIGHRHFKSQSVGAEDLQINRPPDKDGGFHPQILHPALEVAWYNRNPRALKLLSEWGDAWLDHLKLGEYATSVEVATETVDAADRRALWGGDGGQAAAFAWLYWITDDAKYLRPFIEGWTVGPGGFRIDRHLPELLHRGALDPLFDTLRARLARSSAVEGRPVAQTLLTGDKTALVEALKLDIAELQRFRHMYTSAEQFTDRIFLNAANRMATAYTGGYSSRNKFNHTYAVRYEGLGTNYAALVQYAGRTAFRALYYNFADTELSGRIRFWMLEHGRYQVTVGRDLDGDDQADTRDVEEVCEFMRGSSLPIVLQPAQVTVLEMRQIEKMDDELLRPDLALSPLDTTIQGSVIRGVAHNIGAADTPPNEVALVSPTGEIVSRCPLNPMRAPLDLVPSRQGFVLDGYVGGSPGWRIVIDPRKKLRELFEGNNTIYLRG